MNFLSRFIGQATVAIDGKGRCAFPREFRRSLALEDGTEFVLTNWSNGNLRLFVGSDFDKFMAEVESWPDRDEAEEYQGYLQPSIVELDGQNRILLPKDKMKYAALMNSITFVASGGKSLVLWNTEKYEAKFSLDSEDKMAKFNRMCYFKADSTGGASGQK